MTWSPILDAYGRPARPVPVPVFNTQLRRDLYDAASDPQSWGWRPHDILGPDGQSAGDGFVVRFLAYDR